MRKGTSQTKCETWAAANTHLSKLTIPALCAMQYWLPLVLAQIKPAKACISATALCACGHPLCVHAVSVAKVIYLDVCNGRRKVNRCQLAYVIEVSDHAKAD